VQPSYLTTAIAIAVALAIAFAVPPARATDDVCMLPSASADTQAATLSWLAGNWIETKNDETVRERWAGPYGGVLLGVGVTTKGEAAKSFEFFRIAKTATGVSYFASPNAAAPTEFKAIEVCSDKVVFENKAHDFPQRVIYTRGVGRTLNARIEGTIKGKLEGEDWHYRLER